MYKNPVTLRLFLCSAVFYSFSLFAMLPKVAMPEAKKQEEIVVLSTDELSSASKDLYKKLRRAAQQGFFYVEMPQEIAELLEHAVDFGSNFYKNEELKAVKLPTGGGYKDWEHAQMETFFCERSYWEEYYPSKVVELAERLIPFSLEIFNRIFPLVVGKLPRDRWNKAVGDLFEKDGSYHFSFNHYRRAKQMLGIQEHQDFGYITLLFITKDGLHGKFGHDSTYQPIPRKEGYIIVNFGKAFEILVNDTSKLIGGWHYVEQITEEQGERISFGLFSDNKHQTPLHRITETGDLEVVYENYGKYLEASLAQVDKKGQKTATSGN